MASDAAVKTRILTHMNSSHSDSLSLYLRHYCSLSASTVNASPTLTDISFSALTIRDSTGSVHEIPISPPMTSWADARLRTVAMDAECRAALGLPPAEQEIKPETKREGKVEVQLTRYIPPENAIHITIMSLCIMTFMLFSLRGLNIVAPGTFFYDRVLRYWPFGGSKGFVWTLDRIAAPTLVLHTTEAWAFDRYRLKKYGVERGTPLWWRWMGSCFLEGWGSWDRIAREVRRLGGEKEKRNEAKRH